MEYITPKDITVLSKDVSESETALINSLGATQDESAYFQEKNNQLIKDMGGTEIDTVSEEYRKIVLDEKSKKESESTIELGSRLGFNYSLDYLKDASLDYPTAVVGAIADIPQAIANTALDAYSELSKYGYDKKIPTVDELRFTFADDFYPRSKQFGPNMLRNIISFASGSMAIGAVSSFAKAAKAVDSVGKIKNYTSGLVKSGIVEGILGNPESDDMLSALSKEYKVLSWLPDAVIANESDSNIEKKVKYAMQGAMMGAAGDLAVKSVMSIVKRSKLSAASKRLDAAESKIETMPKTQAEVVQPPELPIIKDEVVQPPELPIIKDEVVQPPELPIIKDEVVQPPELPIIKDEVVQPPELPTVEDLKDAEIAVNEVYLNKDALGVDFDKFMSNIDEIKSGKKTVGNMSKTMRTALEDNKELYDVIAASFATFEDSFLDAKRGIISNKELRALALQSGIDIKRILQLKSGSVLNAEDLFTAHGIFRMASKRFSKVYSMWKSDNTLENYAAVKESYSLMKAISIKIKALDSEAGRSLNAVKLAHSVFGESDPELFVEKILTGKEPIGPRTPGSGLKLDKVSNDLKEASAIGNILGSSVKADGSHFTISSSGSRGFMEEALELDFITDRAALDKLSNDLQLIADRIGEKTLKEQADKLAKDMQQFPEFFKEGAELDSLMSLNVGKQLSARLTDIAEKVGEKTLKEQADKLAKDMQQFEEFFKEGEDFDKMISDIAEINAFDSVANKEEYLFKNPLDNAIVDAHDKGKFYNFLDLLNTMRYNGMLSGLKTTSVTLLSNAVSSSDSILETAVGRGLSIALRDNVVAPGEIHQKVLSAIESIPLAIKSAKSTLLTGNTTIPSIKREYSKASFLRNKDEANPILRSLDYMVMRFGGRNVQTADELFKVVNFEMTKNQMLQNEFYKSGLPIEKRAEFFNTVSSSLHPRNSEDYIKNVGKSYTELLAMQENIYDKSKQEAIYRTMQTDLSGGYLAVYDAMQSNAVTRTVFPFMKTALNIVNYGVEHSPLAPISKKFREQLISTDPKTRREAQSKLAYGSMLLASLTLAMYKLEDTVQGKYSTNINKKEVEKTSEKQMYSIAGYKVSGITPHDFALKLAIDSNKLAGDAYASPESSIKYDELMLGGVSMLLSSVTPEFLTEDLPEMIDAVVSASTGDTGALKTTMSKLVSSYQPLSSLGRSITNELSEYKTDFAMYDSLYEKTVAQFKSQSIVYDDTFKYLNIFGEEVKKPHGLGFDMMSPIAATEIDKSLLMQELDRLVIGGTMLVIKEDDNRAIPLSIKKPSRIVSASKSVNGLSVYATHKLTPEQYYTYQKYASGINMTEKELRDSGLKNNFPNIKTGSLREALSGLVDSSEYQDPKISDDIRAAWINKIITVYRDAGFKKMRAEGKIPELNDNLNKQLAKLRGKQ